MRRIIFSLIVCLFMFPSLVDAYECSASDRERLQKFANNVTFTLEEVVYDGNVYFDVLFTGVSKEIKLYVPSKSGYYWNNLNDYIGEVSVDGFSDGNKYIVYVYGNTICPFETLRTITINLPTYNQYYNDKICNSARNYKLCQKWVGVDVSYEEFVSKVNEFIQSENQKNEAQIKNEYKPSIFMQLYEKYYWPVLIGLVCILGLLIYFWIKENNKNKL